MPSPPKTFAFLPCSASCWANDCASPGFCEGKNTTSASLGTFVTYEEKSVTVFGHGLRRVVTSAALSAFTTSPARPCEYGSWKSKTTTFLTLSTSTMYFASVGPW